jgi:hypothetical protein
VADERETGFAGGQKQPLKTFHFGAGTRGFCQCCGFKARAFSISIALARFETKTTLDSIVC